VRLRPPNDPRRARPKPLGRPVAAAAGDRLVGLSVPDARHHLHVIGVTGAGKSTWLAHHTLAEADAGRGVALIDVQGDLAANVLARLPAHAADRLILIEPGDPAPPAWNPLHPHPARPSRHESSSHSRQAETVGAEWAAEGVVAVFRRMHGGVWGPRMDDLLRVSCLTLVRRPGSTIADIVPLLTTDRFRRNLIAHHGEPEGLDGFWDGLDHLSPGARAQLCGPILARLRAVLARRLARDLLTAPASTIDLGTVLDGAILIARIPKGDLGEDVARLIGGLLMTGLWAHATRRSNRPPEHRPDATIIVDEAHNVLRLPIGVDDALAEARGYRVSLVLAHQHLAQLPPEVGHALDANARNKIYLTTAPGDARHLARHVAPVFDEHDLSARRAFHATIRAIHHGRDLPAFSVAIPPLPDPPPGRAALLRNAARANAGLTDQQRQHQRRQLLVADQKPARAGPPTGAPWRP
jgi:hypothetical protein